MKLLPFLVLAACACSAKSQPPINGSGSGTGTLPVESGECASVKAKVEGLYRAEAQVKEPKRVDQAVADNTQMVMNDCAKSPAKVTACIQAATTIAELESKCLRQLDDEGTEGNDLK